MQERVYYLRNFQEILFILYTWWQAGGRLFMDSCAILKKKNIINKEKKNLK